jgi:peptidoglycan/LPS O-acetylase OafA/YrhL
MPIRHYTEEKLQGDLLVIEKATKPANNRTNNFGFLRLLFATLVVVSHSPEILDGNRSREILTRIFHTMSLGEVGVHGFFIISGYLITKSFVESRSTSVYLTKRFLRIVPGYLANFAVCVFLIAPFVGGGASIQSISDLEGLLFQALTLSPPDVPGVFHDLPYPALNSAMWTIAYEFRCYLAAAFFGVLGLYTSRYRTILLILLIALLVLDGSGAMHGIHTVFDYLHGSPQQTVEFSGIFGVGAFYYLFRDKVPLTGAGALAAAILLIPLLFSHALAGVAFSIFGGYLILWFALRVQVLGVSRFGSHADISYGLYLYAWPIQNLIAWNDRTIDPWLLCCLATLGAGLLGYASWRLVEKPMLRIAHGGPTQLRNSDAALGAESALTHASRPTVSGATPSESHDDDQIVRSTT